MNEEIEKSLEPFTKKPYRMKRLDEYKKRMSQDNDHIVYDDNVADMLRAQGYSIDEAPRSIYRVDKLYEALSKYAPGKIGTPRQCTELHAGKALARACFSKPKDEQYLKVLPFTPATIVQITSNPQGSPGLTAWGSTKAESMTRALERGLETVKREKAPEPCLAFSRTQFNEKTRLVWGYPYSMTAIEGLIAHNLIDTFKSRNTPMAFAIATGALGTKLRVAAYHKEWAYSIDMSSYDSSISASLIHDAFKILRSWYDQNEIEPMSGRTVRQIFDIVEKYFIHTPIVMPDGNLYLGKNHGVPSGSFFTQMIDSIVNVIIAGTIAARFNMHVSKKEIFVLGDDLLMWSNRQMDLRKIANYASETFGVTFNAEKSERFHYDEVVHYLGRNWDKGLPTLDESEILKRMVYPERYRRYPKDEEERKRAVRLLILSYASVYWHAWSIANKTLGSEMWYKQGGACVDINTYYHGGKIEVVDPEYQTGLERYLNKYVRTRNKGDIPNTATQIWL